MKTVLIIPDAYRDAANALGEAMGWGPNNYSIPLSTGGVDPATHWGVAADTGGDFAALVAGAKQGVFPEGIDRIEAVMVNLFVAFNHDEAYPTAREHFAAVLVERGLVRIEEITGIVGAQ